MVATHGSTEHGRWDGGLAAGVHAPKGTRSGGRQVLDSRWWDPWGQTPPWGGVWFLGALLPQVSDRGRAGGDAL